LALLKDNIQVLSVKFNGFLNIDVNSDIQIADKINGVSLLDKRSTLDSILINNKAVANLIREARTHEINVVIETGSESGMIDMNKSLAELVRAGEITPEDARTYSFNPNGLEKLI